MNRKAKFLILKRLRPQDDKTNITRENKINVELIKKIIIEKGQSRKLKGKPFINKYPNGQRN